MNERLLNIWKKYRMDELLALYEEADNFTAQFKNVVGLDCQTFCGHCCEKKDIEVTIYEFLPLAFSLWEKDEADLWLQKIEVAEKVGDTICVFYKKAAGEEKGKGFCVKYGLRGLLCRLFGFSVLKNKNGGHIFAVCSVLKIKNILSIEHIQELLDKGVINAPSMTDYYSRLSCLVNDFNMPMYPVNTAVKKAVEKIGYEIENCE
ncbi:fe-S-cluster oxidoreductase [Candidatus Omnitrophus magneticus]|uniref:Fe-S-cluster oxidoreductase n=1 Tax=Candidatus Omnitrophus magneticus TaxID=1609969 RepID=A0A0F0CQU3_9BACT|nr:fe-S-cluster oxidoreductase [Candidatus Omnitrophus magneticus]